MSSIPPLAFNERVIPSQFLLDELEAEAEAEGQCVAYDKWLEFNRRKDWMQSNKKTGKVEPIVHHRASLMAFIEHISPENQCSRDKPNNNRIGRGTEEDHDRGF